MPWTGRSMRGLLSSVTSRVVTKRPAPVIAGWGAAVTGKGFFIFKDHTSGFSQDRGPDVGAETAASYLFGTQDGTYRSSMTVLSTSLGLLAPATNGGSRTDSFDRATTGKKNARTHANPTNSTTNALICAAADSPGCHRDKCWRCSTRCSWTSSQAPTGSCCDLQGRRWTERNFSGKHKNRHSI